MGRPVPDMERTTTPVKAESWLSSHPLRPLPALTYRLIKAFVVTGPLWVWKTIRLILFVVLLTPAWINLAWYYFVSGDIIKNVRYGKESRNLLDIYLPPNWLAEGDSVTCNGRGRPTVLFVSGGAWTIGYKAWGALLAKILVQNGVVFLAPDYRNFPSGTLPDMKDDFATALAWTHRNVTRFGGDPENITVFGQSAGAHISLLGLIDLARQELRRVKDQSSAAAAAAAAEAAVAAGVEVIEVSAGENSSGDLSDVSDMVEEAHSNGNGLRKRHNNHNSSTVKKDSEKTYSSVAASGTESDTTPADTPASSPPPQRSSPSSSASSSSSLSSLQQQDEACDDQLCRLVRAIRGYVGISGPYDLVGMQDLFHRNGLDRRVLAQIMGPITLEDASPTRIVRGEGFRARGPTGESLASILPPIALLHGTSDVSCPCSSSVQLASALADAGSVVTLRLYAGKSHTDPVIEDLMYPETTTDDLIVDIIELIRSWSPAPTPRRGMAAAKPMNGEATGAPLALPEVAPHRRFNLAESVATTRAADAQMLKIPSKALVPRWAIYFARLCNPF